MNSLEEIGDEVSIAVGTDGTCPQSVRGIRQEGPGKFRIFPSWRPGKGIDEESRGLGFRFGVILRNHAKTVKPVEIVVDWQVPEPHPRRVFDSLFTLPPVAADWTMIRGEWNFPVAEFSLDASPGDTWVGLNPRCNVGDLADFLEGLKKSEGPNVSILSIGSTRQGRDIPEVLISPGSNQERNPKPAVLITARMHPYESAGSYAVEGMIDCLLSRDSRDYRGQYTFHIVPMVNVDGVHNGLSRLTDLQGANVNRVHAAKEPTHEAISSLVKRLRPRLMIDLHQFLEKSRDDARCTDKGFLRRLSQRLPDQSRFDKHWHLVDWSSEKIKEEDVNWCQFAAREFDTTGLLFELPWFKRSCRDMRLLGRYILQAVLDTDREDSLDM